MNQSQKNDYKNTGATGSWEWLLGFLALCYYHTERSLKGLGFKP